MRFSFLSIAWQLLAVSFAQNEQCYDDNGDSKYCSPASQLNVAADVTPTASSTCGLEAPERVCYRAGAAGGEYAGTCETCNSSALSPALMTDDEGDGITYWQSQTYSFVQYPNSVNVTVSLGKTFAVDSISLVFQSSRPESFTLLASVDYGDTFQPLHYFSRSCGDTYGVDDGAGSSDAPGCSSDGAQIVPLAGGGVSFAATELTDSSVLATDVRIRLDRLNTFGDEQSWEPMVLDSYYYAISDVIISGTCFCNGHASSCSQDDAGQLKCDCAHNTTGKDCDACLPLFNDLAWRPASQEDAGECKECVCNGHASQCSFSEEVFSESGSVSGGECECQFNTTGNNCEKCVEGQYPNSKPSDPPCSPCVCNPLGVVSADGSCETATDLYQTFGTCNCSSMVMGDTCSQCEDGYFGLVLGGCQACNCSDDGSENSTCDQVTGQCLCHEGYYGRTCLPCGCDTTGTVDHSPDCDSQGKCACSDGFGEDSCDQCLPGYYHYQDQCLLCGCNPHGSTDSVCDTTTGQCSCKDGVLSRDCSICSAGFHSVEEGCLSCLECYSDVQYEYSATVSLLEELVQTINSSLNSSMLDSDLLDVLASIRQELLDLRAMVSNLSASEMELSASIQSAATALVEREAMISLFHGLVVSSENVSSSSAQRASHSSAMTLQIRDVVEEIGGKLTQYAQSNLTVAEQLVSELQVQLAILASTANQSQQASLEQEGLVQQLLEQAVEVLNASILAHSTMCTVLETENMTLSLLELLLSNDIPVLDLLLNQAQLELSLAVTGANSSLNESIDLLNRLANIFIPEYDPGALVKEAEQIHLDSAQVIDESMFTLSKIEIYQQNFTELNLTVWQFSELAVSLNDTALDLAMRAHAARALGRVSVTEAEAVINQSNFLLLELQTRLKEVLQFVAKLESLLSTIEEAESVSAEAETEALNQKELLLAAIETADMVVKLLVTATTNIQSAAETAAAANENADTSLTNTQVLKTEVETLSSAVNDTEQLVPALEDRADMDSQAITEAEVVANFAASNASAARIHVMNVAAMLDSISDELGSVDLVSKQKFDDIMSTLDNSDLSLNSTEMILEAVQEGVLELEQQFALLQERYTTLLQHRDLLRDIFESISQLDCIAEFKNP